MQLFRNEARVKQLFSWYICRGQCVISSILSRHSKNLKRQTEQCCSSVLQLSFIWQAKENTSLRHVGGLTQQMQREEKPRLNIGSSFYVFLLPPSLPYVDWASQEGCLFYLRSSLRSLDLSLFYFCGFSPSLSFSHHHFELLYPTLTI